MPETVHHVICPVNVNKQLSYFTQARTESITDNIHPSEVIKPWMATIKSAVQRHDNSATPLKIETIFKDQPHKWREIRSICTKMLKQQLLIKIIDKFNMSQCMIFCRTNLDCDNLETFLCAVGGGRKFTERQESGKEHPYSCCVLGGMRSTEERRRHLEAFKGGDVRFLICTDVAARGIDVQGLPFVVNITLPDASEQYIHRIGRVGRADKMGLAISLVAMDENPTTDVSEKVW